MAGIYSGTIPRVPTELEGMIDDRFMQVHEGFSRLSLDDLKPDLPMLGQVMIGDEVARVAVIDGDPEAGVDIYCAQYQQTLNHAHAFNLLYSHEQNNPEGVSVYLPNNSISSSNYDFTDSELRQLNTGKMRPFYVRQVRTVEAITRKYRGDIPVRLNGYSLGGLVSVGMASVGSDNLNLAAIRSIEAPNMDRSHKQLQADFKKSGTITAQLKSVKDAELPALSEIFRIDRLIADYAKFGLAYLLNAGNKALSIAMATPDFDKLVSEALANYPEADIMLGHVALSRLFSPEIVTARSDQLRIVEYTGSATHGHSTGNNIVASALMTR